MGGLPSDIGVGSTIRWSIPQEILKRTDIDTVNIWRSPNENKGYVMIDSVPYGTTCAHTTYNDPDGSGHRYFYLVTFRSTASNWESVWHLTYFPPSPHEAYLVGMIKRATPQVMQNMMTDEDYINGLVMAVQIFNAYPPETTFRLCDFPRSHEAFLFGLGQLTALSSRFLPLSIRDWRYSEPGGIVMDINRGEKINQAMEIIGKVYTQYLPLVKMDFSWDSPMAMGTIQLPMSMGGIVSRGLLNILDIFTATGR